MPRTEAGEGLSHLESRVIYTRLRLVTHRIARIERSAEEGRKLAAHFPETDPEGKELRALISRMQERALKPLRTQKARLQFEASRRETLDPAGRSLSYSQLEERYSGTVLGFQGVDHNLAWYQGRAYDGAVIECGRLMEGTHRGPSGESIVFSLDGWEVLRVTRDGRRIFDDLIARKEAEQEAPFATPAPGRQNRKRTGILWPVPPLGRWTGTSPLGGQGWIVYDQDGEVVISPTSLRSNLFLPCSCSEAVRSREPIALELVDYDSTQKRALRAKRGSACRTCRGIMGWDSEWIQL